MKPLDTQLIASLLGHVSNKQKHEIEAKVTECMDILNAKFPRNPIDDTDVYDRPTVTFDLRGRTAGWAIGNTEIRLNVELLHTNYEQMLEQTLPHEIAHCAVHQRFGNRAKAHGYEWQVAMRALGLKPDRTHAMPTKPARKHPRPHEYYCPSCGKVFHLTHRLHNQVMMGRYRICPRCKTEILYQGSYDNDND